MNKQQLAAKIWESANRMRSKIEANEYKDYILGFIFYKYLSDKEERWLLSRDYTPDDIRDYVNENDPETVSSAQQSLGYFIAYADLFSTWIHMGPDFSVDNVRTALSSFTRLISPSHKKVFDGIFNTLETGLSKLGENARAQTKAVSDLIQLINDIPMDGKQDYDVLGFIYEYLISQFAANAGKKAGEFYTPHEVSLLMSEIVAEHLKGRSEIRIYDPTSGSGSLLLCIGHAIAKYMDDPNRIRYYAQELKANTYNLTRMNLVMRGILPDNIVTRNGDTLEDDWPYFDDSDPASTYDPLYVDAVVSNPPYSQRWDPQGKENDPRYADYGVAPKAKADYAFLLHDLFHVKPEGIMTIVLPHGVLFRGGEEGKIRKNLIENNKIDAIIGLPANIFYGTGIPTIIMVLRQSREHTDVLIVDASKGFAKEGKNNKLRACDIRRIVDVVTRRKNVPKYSRKVSKEEIRSNDYNLNIPRYVDSSEPAESWDVYASMFGGVPVRELEELQDFWKVFPSLKEELFDGDGGYVQVKAQNVRQAIEGNPEVQAFRKQYQEALAGLEDRLTDLLIDQAQTVSIARAEDEITNELFRRMESVPLVDPYEAYELFHSHYEKISGDLELIQTEGKETVTQVDPNMVLKKKNGSDAEVQEGWKGHILPFELVQKTLLAREYEEIEDKKKRLQEIPSERDALLEELDEEEKEAIAEALDENREAFVLNKVGSVLKELKKEKDPENADVITCLQKADQLSQEEKKIKAEIKTKEEAFELLTKEKIENLTSEEADALLKQKWILPIMDGIQSLPANAITALEKSVEALRKKYADTYEDIESEIRKTEDSLSQMLGELTGSEADLAGIAELRKLLGGEF